MEEKKFVLVKLEEAHLWEPVSECAFPLSELRPRYPLTPEDRRAIEAQIQREETERAVAAQEPNVPH